VPDINLITSAAAVTCTRFGSISPQEAAGVFGELRDTVSLRVEAPRPVDLSPECAHMLERLCLAQVPPASPSVCPQPPTTLALTHWHDFPTKHRVCTRRPHFSFPAPLARMQWHDFQASRVHVAEGGCGFLLQAQEVTFEKFREDKKSPAILARWEANLPFLDELSMSMLACTCCLCASCSNQADIPQLGQL
jgi:hypothetical protein